MVFTEHIPHVDSCQPVQGGGDSNELEINILHGIHANPEGFSRVVSYARQSYEAPETVVVEIKTDGCILQSSGERSPYNPVTW